MKLYKLTDENDRTYGGCRWGEGVERGRSGRGPLCGPGWLHAYTDSLLAVLLNPLHAYFDPETYHLWECDGDVGETDHGLKVGCTRIKTIRRIPPPEVSSERRVRFAILCTLRVTKDGAWRVWAGKWLSGEDRSFRSAEIARPDGFLGAAWEAAEAAAWVDVPAGEVAVQNAAARAVSYAAKVALAAGTPMSLAGIAREAVEDSR